MPPADSRWRHSRPARSLGLLGLLCSGRSSGRTQGSSRRRRQEDSHSRNPGLAWIPHRSGIGNMSPKLQGSMRRALQSPCHCRLQLWKPVQADWLQGRIGICVPLWLQPCNSERSRHCGKSCLLGRSSSARCHFSSQMSPSLQCIVICASRRTLPRRMWPSTSCMTASSFTRSRGVSASGMFHWRCQTMLFLMTSPTQRLSSIRYQAPWNCSQNVSEDCERDADGRLVTSPQVAQSSRQGRS